MVDIRTTETGNLEFLHPESNSYVPVYALIENAQGYMIRLIQEQEDLIENILTELTEIKTVSGQTSNVNLISTQETILVNIIAELQQIETAIANQTLSTGDIYIDTANLENLTSNILNNELPLIRNFISSINNKIPTGQFPVALANAQETLLNSIVALLTTINTYSQNIGINTDDLYTVLSDVFDSLIDDTTNTNAIDNLIAIKENILTLQNANTTSANTTQSVLNEIKSLLPGSVVNEDALATHLLNIANKLEDIRTLERTVSLVSAQASIISEISSKLSDVINNTNAIAGLGNYSTTGIEGFLSDMKVQTTDYSKFGVELIGRQESYINDIQAELSQARRYLGRLVDPLGVDADGSQIAVSQDISQKLIDIDDFIRGRFVSEPCKIANLVLVNANQEYTFTLPANTKRYAFKVRGGSTDVSEPIRFAFVSGIVASETPSIDDGFDTVYPESEESDRDLAFTSPVNVYFASSVPNVAVTIKYWR